jgi:hypothetical protein
MHVAVVNEHLQMESMQHVHAMIPEDMDHMLRMTPPGGWETFENFPLDLCDEFYAHMGHEAPKRFGPSVTLNVQFTLAQKYVLFAQTKSTNGQLLFARFVIDVHKVRCVSCGNRCSNSTVCDSRCVTRLQPESLSETQAPPHISTF